MNEWTPNNVLGLVIGILFVSYVFGVFDLVEEWVRKR